MIVWVWAGHLDSSSDVFDYLEFAYQDGTEETTSSFTKDFGIPWFDEDFREAVQEPSPKKLRELIDGASYFSDFIDEVEVAAKNVLPDEIANTAILLFDSDFEPGEIKGYVDGLFFIGSFEFEPTQ